MRCIGTIGQRVANPVANRQTRDAITNRLDNTGTFRSQHMICFDWPWIQTIADINIQKIDADCLMPDQHLSGSRGHVTQFNFSNHL